jgi:hypothetical protein
MKISNYLVSLLPSFHRNTVLEDCKITKTELKEATIPAYTTAVQLLHNWKFKSDIIQKHQDSFRRLVKTPHSKNIVVAIHDSLNQIVENLTDVEDLIGKTFSEEVAGGGLTYAKANLLQFVEATAFVSKYARKFLLYVYILESNELEGNETGLKDAMAPAEIKWIGDNFMSFCVAFKAVSMGTNNVKKLIDGVPDILVTRENASTLPSTVGENKLDPFNMRFIPTWMNPIYHIGMLVAEWQADRYKAAKEELKLLQMRKMNLEKLHEKKPDAHLQKQIAYMEGRVQGLNYKIDKMEKAYG